MEPETSPRGKRLSLSRILDFSFPDELPEPDFVQVGEVTYVGDGVCHISGLDKATVEEVVEIHTHKSVQKALILGVQEEKVEAVVLGDYSQIKRGDEARSTGTRLRAPAGESLLGRVINPLGIPLDGKGAVKPDVYRDVEFPAPAVMERSPIDTPMHTGVMIIDSTIPIGKGQRELVVGDRKSGKSRTMIDVICNQQGHGVFCIYVGVGIQAAKAKATLKMLEDRGAMKYTTMVVALADEPPSLQYIAPYVGCAIGEHYMYSGRDALIIYDDLSKQAKAYRQVSLLLKRSPGRDAYPGDIFFLHSRLLERASRLSPKLKGGSLTALPIAETQAGDISDYIITNLMSITDGHIYLDSNMMHEGFLPAVNSGASVSRIGGKVQSPLLRKVGELAGRVLARYNEVKSFETINTEVSEDTIREIKRGKRMREILAQDSNLNLSADEQVILLGVATSSRMDHFELSHVITFKQNIIPFYRLLDLRDFREKANTSKSMEEVDPILDKIFNDFCKQYKLPLPYTGSTPVTAPASVNK
jgi:F-type H+-transporting ATPase subunit alpha